MALGELLFAVGFLGGFFLLISFYSAIANGPRFIEVAGYGRY
jgi:hypothetical protein